MIIEVTLTTRIILPEGTKPPEDMGRQFTLPDGNWIKPFVTLEKNDDEDMTYDQAVALGLDYDEISFDYREIAE